MFGSEQDRFDPSMGEAFAAEIDDPLTRQAFDRRLAQLAADARQLIWQKKMQKLPRRRA